MADDPLVVARKRAERAVEGMADGPLKIAAFQTILAKLLAESDPTEQVQRVSVKAPAGRSEARADECGKQAGVEIFEPLSRKPSPAWKNLDRRARGPERMTALIGWECAIAIVAIVFSNMLS